MAAGSTTTLGEGRGCRWGILSCGKIANDFATALRLVDGVVHLEENGGGGGGGAKDAAAAAAAAGRHSHSVVACAASSQQRAAEFGAKHGVSPERCYGDYAELARDPEVDVVYVASIHTQHKEHVMKLLECGKHVLCEKPMAVCARDVRAMVDKAREKGVFMMEGMWTRFFPAVVEARRLIASGAIGDVVSVHADFAFSDELGGIPRIWRREHAGGGLLDVGIYPLAVASMAFGGRRPASVVATGALHGGIDATGGAVLRYAHEEAGGGGGGGKEGGGGGGLDGVAVVSWGVRSATGETCFIAGTRGSIKIPSPMHCPDRLIFTTTGAQKKTTMEMEFPLPGVDLAAAAARRAAGDECASSPSSPRRQQNVNDAAAAADDASYFYTNSRGFAYEAAEVWRCIQAGRAECPQYTLGESVVLAETMDDIRRQMGVRYDEDDDDDKSDAASASASAAASTAAEDAAIANLRVAVFGATGRMGRIHCDNLRELGVKTVVSVDLGDEVPAAGTVDAAVISSPSDVHEAHLSIACGLGGGEGDGGGGGGGKGGLGGVPAYCEKPLTSDWSSSVACAGMLAAAGARVQMGFQRRFDAQLLVRRRAGGGECEPLHSVAITSRDPKPPPEEYIKSMGSHFADMTIHDLDEARWMLGAGAAGAGAAGATSVSTSATTSTNREPTRCYATMNDEKTRATVVLKTPEGQHCVIVNDRTCVLGYDQRVEVMGGGGVARLDQLPTDPDGFFEERYADAYKAAMRSFLVDVVVGGKAPEVGVLDALHASNLARACDESLAAGCEVEVPPLPPLYN